MQLRFAACSLCIESLIKILLFVAVDFPCGVSEAPPPRMKVLFTVCRLCVWYQLHIYLFYDWGFESFWWLAVKYGAWIWMAGDGIVGGKV